MLKKVITSVICLILAASSAFAVPAAAEEKNHGIITVDTVSALNGDSVVVKIGIENNPGIMAMTISIKYDSSALTFESYYEGYLWDYTVADHPEQGLIRFVNCEPWNKFNNDTMISLQFKVNDDAFFGFYPIYIEYNDGDFCNWKLDRFSPKTVSGGIDVAFNGKNCKHKSYGEWKTVARAGCVKNGAKQRICQKCGHVDIGTIPPVGHDFEDNWTIDRQATVETSGVMSRHCKNCSEVTDTLTFSLEQAEQEELENEVNASLKPSDFTESLVEEQIPPEERNDAQKDPTNTSDGIFTQVSQNGIIGKILAVLQSKSVICFLVTLVLIAVRLIFI